MPDFLFVSDLHGKSARYSKLFQAILQNKPAAVLLGGDLLPSAFESIHSPNMPASDFMTEVLTGGFRELKKSLGHAYPRVFLILGNDDSKLAENELFSGADEGLWDYIHLKKARFGIWTIIGYSCIPPSPFQFKDFEKYDVSQFVDPGCIPPEEGWHSVPVNKALLKRETIQADLNRLAPEKTLENTILLFHCPPYQSLLDRAALDGMYVDHVPLDVHIGSIAIRRFIESRQPGISLHGHVHESTRLTGSWKDMLGDTLSFSAAHDGEELALIRFDPDHPELAVRELI